MPQDYKYRVHQDNIESKTSKVARWKWGVIIGSITLFIVGLLFLQYSGVDNSQKPSVTPVSIPKKPVKIKKPESPQFDFYTILPETEIVVPDYEIKTRHREEKKLRKKPIKTKSTQYIMQAGSFREFVEADKLRARLALMGIESRIEKTKIGHVIWNRVKIGPFKRSSSVSVIKKQLNKNGLDVIVTELKR